ncbi:MAG: PAS-domain containing protein [Alphaproteobacteria bacterium]
MKQINTIRDQNAQSAKKITDFLRALNLFDRIPVKLLAVVIPFFAIVYIIAFGLIEYRHYTKSRAELIENGQRLLNLQTPALELALWEFNDERIDVLLNRMAQMNFVEGVMLQGLGGENLSSSGTIGGASESAYELSAPLYYTNLDAAREIIGRLRIDLHERHLTAQLRSDILFHALTLILLSVAICWIIFFLSRHFIDLRLQGVRHAIERSRNENSHEAMVGENNDEIGQVIKAYNALQNSRSETIFAMQRQTSELKEATKFAEEARRSAETAREQLRNKVAEVERFNALAVGREKRIAEIKSQVNELCAELKREPYYNFVEDGVNEDSPDDRALEDAQGGDAAAHTSALSDPEKQAEHIREIFKLQASNNLFTRFAKLSGVSMVICDLDENIVFSQNYKPEDNYQHHGVYLPRHDNLARIEEIKLKDENLTIYLYHAKDGLIDLVLPLYYNSELCAKFAIGRIKIIDENATPEQVEAAQFAVESFDYTTCIMDYETLVMAVKFLNGIRKLITSLTQAQMEAKSSNKILLSQREAALSLAEDATIARKELSEYQLHLQKLIDERTKNLEETTSLLQLALSNMSDGIFMLDRDMRFQLFNKRYLELLQVPEGFVTIGAPVENLIRYMAERGDYRVDDVESWVRFRMRQFQDGTNSTVEVFVVDGPIIEIHQTRTHDGGVVAVASDQTKRKLAEQALAESEERSRMILNTVAEGILGIDRGGYITFINSSACQLLGYEHNELIGQAMHDLINYSRADGTKIELEESRVLHTLMKGVEQNNDDEVLWRKDGSHFPVAYFCKPIHKDGALIGAVFTFQDITERRESERELAAKMEELENFSLVAVGRELKMIELKKMVNDYAVRVGEDERFDAVEATEAEMQLDES